MKVEIDSFSGYKIYPSKGMLYVRGDSKVFRFATSKTESLFLQRKNPRKISWTVLYRRMHKKGTVEEAAKRRSRKTVKHQRGVAGADLASILARRTEGKDVREKARSDAIAKAKAEKKQKEEKKNKPPRPAGAPGGAPRVSKQQMRGGGAKGGR